MTDYEFPVSASFAVTVGGSRKATRRGRPCVIGRDVEVIYNRLALYCIRNIEPVDVDLMLLGGVVAYVDRTITRRRASGWSRRLSIEMPVHDAARWSSSSVTIPLVQTLNFLTGDVWEFSFVPRATPDEDALQQKLPFKLPAKSIDRVLPYSGGLDSYAELHRLASDPSGAGVFLVTAEHAAGIQDQAKQTVAAFLQRSHKAGVPIRLAGKHREASYRTRTFLFYSIAAIAGRMVGARSIVVPETGQGALGPSIVPYGNEQPYRSTHPAFTLLLRHFLSSVWGTQAPSFEHPHLWKTKAAVLRELEQRGASDDYRLTKSCSHDLRGKAVPGVRKLHCGVCSGCFLRRVAIAIGLRATHDTEQYVWDNLESRELLSRIVGTTDNDRNVAIHGVLTHQHLADRAVDSSGDPLLEQAAFEIAGALERPAADVVPSLNALLQQHRIEWQQFVDRLPQTSWVSRVAGGG